MVIRSRRSNPNNVKPPVNITPVNITPEDVTLEDEFDDTLEEEFIEELDAIAPESTANANKQPLESPQVAEVKPAAGTKQINTTDANSNNQPEYQGRLVFITGDKGGTGKSVVARILLDIYRQRNIKCIAYECDQSNPQLYRHYNKIPPGVNKIKLNQRGGADALQDNLKQFSPQVSLVDMPAGAAEYFENVAKDIFLFQNAQRMGYRITMVSVLSRVKESLSQLKRVVDFCGDRADYVIIKNLYWGDEHKFTRYNNSEIRQTVAKLGGVELLLPELFDDIFDTIDSNDLTFREALEHEVFTLSNQSRVYGWIEACEAEFANASAQLGLE